MTPSRDPIFPGARAPRRSGKRTGWPRRPALVRPRPGVPNEVIVSVGGRTLRATMGRTGIRTIKREGDGATPRGRITPLAGLTRARRVLPLACRRVRGSDGWCEDPASLMYNRFVRRPAPAAHETMARTDALYDVVLATDHNRRPRIRGGGSAIFFHVARPAMTPTEGCLAFPSAAWQRAVVPLGPYLIGIDPRPCR